MKQTWKRITGLLVTLTCILIFFVVPVHGAAAMSEEEQADLKQEFQEMIEMLGSTDREQMESQLSGSVFFSNMLEGFYGAVEESGSFQGITGGLVEINEADSTASITLQAKFGENEGIITAILNYGVTNVKSVDDYWSGFHVEIKYPLSTMLGGAVQNTIIGLVTVFIMLVFLTFIISLFRHINKLGGGKKPPVQELPVVEPAAVLETDSSEEIAQEELTAVIAAAIAAYEEEHGSTDGFVVRSIRKVNTRSWKRA